MNLSIYLILYPLISAGFMLIGRPNPRLAQWGFSLHTVSQLALVAYAFSTPSLGQWMIIITAIIFSLLGLYSLSPKTPPISPHYAALLLGIEGALMGLFLAQNLISFYLFWELAIIPSFLLFARWGSQMSPKLVMRYVLYSLIGSLSMLIALTWISSLTGTTSLEAWQHLELPLTLEWSLFGLLAFAFACKLPLIPLHHWQPDTYAHADNRTTILFSSLLSKMGLFGVIQLMTPLLSTSMAQSQTPVILFCCISMLIASALAFEQTHLKKLFAYASIAHLSLMAAALFTTSPEGLHGTLFQMGAHALTVTGLWIVIDIIYTRTGIHSLTQMGGIRSQTPFLAGTFLVFILGSIGLPLTNGFIGETAILYSLYHVHPLFALIAGTSLILGAAYMLRAYRLTMLGTPNPNTPPILLHWSETLTLSLITAGVLIMGIFPQPILTLCAPPKTDLKAVCTPPSKGESPWYP